MVPGVGFSLALVVTNVLLLSPYEWVRDLSLVSGMMMVVCAIASVGNLIDYRRAMAVMMIERKQNALSRSPLAVELEAARGVHPDSLKVILNERHRVWALRNGNLQAGVRAYDVLYHAPEVTIYFLEYFLKGCTDQSIMPKRVLVQGRKNRFDPYGVVDEYTMYDRLVALLVSQQKIHRWTEFDSIYSWVHPWTPKLVADEWGLELDVNEVSSVPAALGVRVQ
jgi:hypothetical protein